MTTFSISIIILEVIVFEFDARWLLLLLNFLLPMKLLLSPNHFLLFPFPFSIEIVNPCFLRACQSFICLLPVFDFHIIELSTDLVVGGVWHQVASKLRSMLLLFLSFLLFLASCHTIDYSVCLSNFQ